MRAFVVIPDGYVAQGKLAQALVYGAEILAIKGNFDKALDIVRELSEKYPITLVNSVNPYRLQGQKTAAFEIIENLGNAPDWLCIPMGNAGNITAYWKGFKEYKKAKKSRILPKMLGFQAEGSAPLVLNKKIDILVSTTVIEVGIDFPNANLIIIENANKFGLAQLHQLRGRVGRSGVQAHAWLFYPSNEKLNDASRQRLKAIQEFTDLGSGYQLAMRDMEIRGVGNLIGIEQSGQMEAIGFDLYMELLQETIAEIQGQDIPSVEDTQIDLPLTAFIPGDWITDPDEKINAYRLATQCETNEALIKFASNLVDRYGTLPKAVESLIEVMKLKLIARKCGFSRIKLTKPNLELETMMDEPAFKLLRRGLGNHLHGRFIYKKGDRFSTVIIRGLGVIDIDKLIDQLTEWLEIMYSEINTQ